MRTFLLFVVCWLLVGMAVSDDISRTQEAKGCMPPPLWTGPGTMLAWPAILVLDWGSPLADAYGCGKNGPRRMP